MAGGARPTRCTCHPRYELGAYLGGRQLREKRSKILIISIVVIAKMQRFKRTPHFSIMTSVAGWGRGWSGGP